MLDFIADMFATPEAQVSAYVWGAALLGHFAIGVFLTAIAGWMAGAWRGALIVATGYAALWEGGQMLIAGSALSDSAVDAAAVACGAFLAAGSWRKRGAVVAAAMAVLTVIGAHGITSRSRK